MDKSDVLVEQSSEKMGQRGHDYVGFGNFPNQVFRRCIKNGFQFNLMVVGQSGLGKSTLLNSLFLTEIHEQSKGGKPELPSTVSIEPRTVRLLENDVRLDVTFIDCPGFGDLLDNSKCWDPIIEYVEAQFTDYLDQETKIERPTHIDDNRVHLCLYFIAPTGQGLKALDVEFMRALHDRVNLVPLIAKADTLTAKELAQFKLNILSDIARYNIRLYEFPEYSTTNGESLVGGKDENKAPDYRKCIPFAVIGSSKLKENSHPTHERNRRTHVREYPWGTVEVENPAHNDFVALRELIIKKNLVDLIDATKNVHYENFRIRQMSRMPKSSPTDSDPFTSMENERNQMQKRARDTRDSREKVFQQKVKEHEEQIDEKASALDEEEEENRRKLDEKRAELEKLKKEAMEERQARSMTAGESGSSLRGSSPSSEKSKKHGLGFFRK